MRYTIKFVASFIFSFISICIFLFCVVSFRNDAGKENAEEVIIAASASSKTNNVDVENIEPFGTRKHNAFDEKFVARKYPLGQELRSTRTLDANDDRNVRGKIPKYILNEIVRQEGNGKALVVVDKNRGEMYLFDKNYVAVAASPAHLSRWRGSKKGARYHGVGGIATTSTPQGRYHLSNVDFGYRYDVDKKGSFSIFRYDKNGDKVLMKQKIHAMPNSGTAYPAAFYSIQGSEDPYRSHGCIRVPDTMLALLKNYVIEGTRLFITADFEYEGSFSVENIMEPATQ